MRIFTRIVQAIFAVAGIFLAFFLAVCWVKPSLLDTIGFTSEKEQLKFGIVGFSLLLIGIIWVVYWFDHLVRSRNISFDNPHGKVRISLRAIEEFITTKISSQIGNIKSMGVRASLGSHGLETLIHLKITSGYNIPELTSQIQELVKNYLQDVVGVERVSHIEIIITGISAAAQAGGTETPQSQENEQETT
jgi:uncharacterized alkaline shock family protein YloU